MPGCGSATSRTTILFGLICLVGDGIHAGVSGRAGGGRLNTTLRARSTTALGLGARERRYWEEEGLELHLYDHYEVPAEEVQPRGKIPLHLRRQQRYHPHTGVRWGEKQEPAANRSWPPLPGDLTWRTTFIGCKEVKRPAWVWARKRPDTCSIYILDASDVAERLGVPRCDVGNFCIDPRKNLVLPNPARLPYPLPQKHEHVAHVDEMYPWKVGPHYFAQSGGAYYFMKALEHSPIRACNIETADAVFVYDYCYMIWSLAEAHASKHWWLRQRVNYQPNPRVLDYLQRIHNDILASPRYNRIWGLDYVWWLPHTAIFASDDIFGKDAIPNFIQITSCNRERDGLFLAPTVYMRWRCQLYHPERLLVVPQASMDVVSLDLAHRTTFIYFKANCKQPDTYSVGKYFRSMLAQALVEAAGNATDIYAQCLDTVIGSPGYNEESHVDLMRSLSQAIFCPVVPGDSQTSQHLTERYIAGCIPVFVGPPFHTMPFEKEVDYIASAVFVNVTNSSAWLLDVVMEWEFPMVPSGGWDHRLVALNIGAKQVESAKWWFPWVPLDALVSVDELGDVVAYLRSLPPKQVQTMQRAVFRQRSKFIYRWGRPGRPGALDIIVDNICHFIGKGCGAHSNATS